VVLFSDAIDRKELKMLLEELEKIRGRGTELVSVYIPAEYNINEITSLISSEISTAENIKSKTTRKNVISALEKIGQRLKHYQKTPENGLVIFCGNVSQREGVADYKLWEIIPPEPLKVRIYRCDQTFVLDPLKRMVREKEVYGLITIDRSEAAVGFLRGNHISVYKHIDSLVPPKTKAGGQSAQRFERVREGLLLSFLKEVAEVAANAFRNEEDLKGIIVGGPGPLKERFVEEILPQDLREKVIAIKDTSYAGVEALEEVVERAEEELKNAKISKEKKILKEFFVNLAKDTGLVVYGLEDTLQALEMGAVEKLIISEDAPYKVVKYTCPNCGNEAVAVLRKDEKEEKSCEKCGSEMNKEYLSLERYFEKKAEETGAEIVIVSSGTQEGSQFLSLAGIGGLLRYKI